MTQPLIPGSTSGSASNSPNASDVPVTKTTYMVRKAVESTEHLPAWLTGLSEERTKLLKAGISGSSYSPTLGGDDGRDDDESEDDASLAQEVLAPPEAPALPEATKSVPTDADYKRLFDGLSPRDLRNLNFLSAENNPVRGVSPLVEGCGERRSLAEADMRVLFGKFGLVRQAGFIDNRSRFEEIIRLYRIYVTNFKASAMAQENASHYSPVPYVTRSSSHEALTESAPVVSSSTVHVLENRSDKSVSAQISAGVLAAPTTPQEFDRCFDSFTPRQMRLIEILFDKNEPRRATYALVDALRESDFKLDIEVGMIMRNLGLRANAKLPRTHMKFNELFRLYKDYLGRGGTNSSMSAEPIRSDIAAQRHNPKLKS